MTEEYVPDSELQRLSTPFQKFAGVPADRLLERAALIRSPDREGGLGMEYETVLVKPTTKLCRIQETARGNTPGPDRSGPMRRL